MRMVDEFRMCDKKLISFARKKGVELQIKHLYNVKNKEDFDYWERHLGKFLRTQPVVSGKKSTLEWMFE
jgi:hypothetical protein